MEPTRFALTLAQKGMLASLIRETGEPAPTLMAAIASALEELQEREHPSVQDDTNGHATARSDILPSQEAYKPIWERIRETFSNLAGEDLDSLPVDGAAQVDHYVYGLPKR